MEEMEDNDGDQPFEISKDTLRYVMQEVKKAHDRTRKKRVKVLEYIVHQLNGVIPQPHEIEKTEETEKIVEFFTPLTDVLIEVCKLLLGLTDQNMKAAEKLSYEASTLTNILESLFLQVRSWCYEHYAEEDEDENQGPKASVEFVKRTFTPLTKILECLVQCNSLWRCAEIFKTPITIILNDWAAGVAKGVPDMLKKWSQSVTRTMEQFGKNIVKCGDFSCQYFQIITIQQWLFWVGHQSGRKFINSIFHSVDPDVRKLLIDNKHVDFDYVARIFLNSLNSTAVGTSLVTSVRCVHLYAGDGDFEIKGPQDELVKEFWVDFSTISRRIHVLFSLPDNPWISLDIGSEQIDSICVTWLRKNDSQLMTQTQPDQSQVSNLEYESMIFLHVILKHTLDELSPELGELEFKNITSLMFVFKDIAVVEKILQQMSWPTHPNGEMCKKSMPLVNSDPVLPKTPQKIAELAEDLSFLQQTSGISFNFEENEEVVENLPEPEIIREGKPNSRRIGTPFTNPHHANSSQLISTPSSSIFGAENILPMTPFRIGKRKFSHSSTPYNKRPKTASLPGSPLFSSQEFAEFESLSPIVNIEEIAENQTPQRFKQCRVDETPGGFYVYSSEEADEDDALFFGENKNANEFEQPQIGDENQLNDSNADSLSDNSDNISLGLPCNLGRNIKSMNMTMESVMEDPYPKNVREVNAQKQKEARAKQLQEADEAEAEIEVVIKDKNIGNECPPGRADDAYSVDSKICLEISDSESKKEWKNSQRHTKTKPTTKVGVAEKNLLFNYDENENALPTSTTKYQRKTKVMPIKKSVMIQSQLPLKAGNFTFNKKQDLSIGQDKSVPCYKRKVASPVDKSSLLDLTSEFLDPYDITKSREYIWEKVKIKTYPKKRIVRKKRVYDDEGAKKEIEEIDKLLEKIAKKPNPVPKEKKGRPTKPKSHTEPKPKPTKAKPKIMLSNKPFVQKPAKDKAPQKIKGIPEPKSAKAKPKIMLPKKPFVQKPAKDKTPQKIKGTPHQKPDMVWTDSEKGSDNSDISFNWEDSANLSSKGLSNAKSTPKRRTPQTPIPPKKSNEPFSDSFNLDSPEILQRCSTNNLPDDSFDWDNIDLDL